MRSKRWQLTNYYLYWQEHFGSGWWYYKILEVDNRRVFYNGIPSVFG